jgi:hypothetical protein
MEYTLDEVEQMVNNRIKAHPAFAALISSGQLLNGVRDAIVKEHLDDTYVDPVLHEIKMVLSFYSPFSELSLHIHETANIPLPQAESIVHTLTEHVFKDVYTDLVALDECWFDTEQDEMLHTQSDIEEEKTSEKKVDNTPQLSPVTPQRTLRDPSVISGTHSEVREPIELRPKGVPLSVPPTPQTPPTATERGSDAVKPLTREELLNALATKRTMASDIEAIRTKRGEATPPTDEKSHKNPTP